MLNKGVNYFLLAIFLTCLGGPLGAHEIGLEPIAFQSVSYNDRLVFTLKQNSQFWFNFVIGELPPGEWSQDYRKRLEAYLTARLSIEVDGVRVPPHVESAQYFERLDGLVPSGEVRFRWIYAIPANANQVKITSMLYLEYFKTEIKGIIKCYRIIIQFDSTMLNPGLFRNK